MLWRPIVLTLIFALNSVQSQIWVGNFTADTSCQSSACCCIGPNIQLTRPSDTLLAFVTGLYGSCLGQTGYTGSSAYPTTYTISVSISIITLQFTLSSDSNRITVVNSMGSTCTVYATRVNPFQTTTTTTAVSGTGGNGTMSSSTNAVATTTRSSIASNFYFNRFSSFSMILISIFMIR